MVDLSDKNLLLLPEYLMNSQRMIIAMNLRRNSLQLRPDYIVGNFQRTSLIKKMFRIQLFLSKLKNLRLLI